MSNRGKTKKGDSKKKPAQLKKIDIHATQDVKVQEGTTEEMCVTGPVFMRAQAKKCDKIHPLKVKRYVKCRQDYRRGSSEEGLYSEEIL